jgi:hypothetical protein
MNETTRIVFKGLAIGILAILFLFGALSVLTFIIWAFNNLVLHDAFNLPELSYWSVFWVVFMTEIFSLFLQNHEKLK